MRNIPLLFNTENDSENQNFVIFEEVVMYLIILVGLMNVIHILLLILGLKVFLLTDEIDFYDISSSTTVYKLGQ